MGSFAWRRLDVPGLELATWQTRVDGSVLSGRVLMLEGEVSLSVDYRIEVDARWVTRLVDVDATADAVPARLRLEHDGAGGWRRDGRSEPSLAGCLDVDLEVTPLTNALAINRLRLPEGAAAEIAATWVHFPGLSIEAGRQRYERLTSTTYRYTGLGTGFTAQVEVDDDGFPVIYERIWQRV
ncbi:MAG: putative glycolipid-binding domain-containing protein [Candidatus Dormibacteraeota bacterium]|nr:putative glycolipid-binding domain-containing protein [Candidatus Dormibacteraeota bacterium]